jgi:hypothetical protein
MKYMFSLFNTEGGWQDASPEDMKAEMDRWANFTKQAIAAGVYVSGDALQESSTATSVRIPDAPDSGGEPIVTDGPFAETKEQLGGYYVLECKDLDEALSYAKKIPLFGGTVEVRPVMDFSEDGYEDLMASMEDARS